MVNSKYWGGANAPIFAYFGAEAPLDYDLPAIGFLTDNAPQFKALLVYIEVSPHAYRHIHKYICTSRYTCVYIYYIIYYYITISYVEYES